jgi:hypothetical protein
LHIAAGLILGYARFKEVLLLAKEDVFIQPRERIGYPFTLESRPSLGFVKSKRFVSQTIDDAAAFFCTCLIYRIEDRIWAF